MPFFDMPLAQLQTYLPERDEPADFDAFWSSTVDEARSLAGDAVFNLLEIGLATVEAYDVTFTGFEGQAVKGWLLLPSGRSGPLPCVVEFIGYGGGRGYAYDWLKWSAFGFAHFVMDTRGQGSSWLHGDTPDNAESGQTPQHPGFMTRGILTPQSYYYRRLMTDAVRAVDTAMAHDAVDASRVVVAGASQGGGLALAVSGLRSDLCAVMSDVPFLCDFSRAIRLIDTRPYSEIAHYLKIHRDQVDRVMQTLSYFDGLNFAVRATAPVLFSVGLMDMVCPPSTVFGAYNHYAGEKQIRTYEFNDHEGGGSHHVGEQVDFLRQQTGNRSDD